MSDYRPIDCNYYDKIEETIILKKIVLIEYQAESGQSIQITSRIIDTLTVHKEEFIILPDQKRMRMDKIIAIDGDTAPGTRHC
ncbi:MAG: hypothetical protein AAF587_17525 [Bacteroidota bacterium]